MLLLMPTTFQNPIYRIKTLAKCIKKDYVYDPEINEEETNNMIDISTEISTLLIDNYGDEIEEDYEVYKYCAKHLIYPVSFEIDGEMINNHNDSTCDIDSLVEEYKDIIIMSLGEGGGIDTFNYICNKIKFFQDCGFHIVPNRFTIMEFDEVKAML